MPQSQAEYSRDSIISHCTIINHQTIHRSGQTSWLNYPHKFGLFFSFWGRRLMGNVVFAFDSPILEDRVRSSQRSCQTCSGWIFNCVWKASLITGKKATLTDNLQDVVLAHCEMGKIKLFIGRCRWKTKQHRIFSIKTCRCAQLCYFST